MADEKTFVVIFSTGDAKTMNVRIKAISFRAPGAAGGSYSFEAPRGVVASFPRETVLAVVDETALAKAE